MRIVTTGWYKIYRPTTINEYIFQNEFDKSIFLKYIKDQDIPDLLFSGHRGTGKTTLGLILKEALNVPDMDFLKLNASDDNSVDTIRTDVKRFMAPLSFGKYKIIFLDEADSLTPQAQDALKSMMEDKNRNARFILTCNKPDKLTPELRSRCTEYKFSSLDRKLMKEYALKILLDQGLYLQNIDHKNLNNLLNDFLSMTYPDFRKFITLLEKHYKDGILNPPTYDDNELEILVEFLIGINENNWLHLRNIIYEKLSTDKIIDVYKFLDNNLSEIKKFKNNKNLLSKGYIIIAHYVYMHENVVIPELNLTACIIKLCELKEIL